MTETDLVDRLANHRTLGAAPRAELEWLAARGTVRQLPVGDTISVKGAPVEGLFVILSGRIATFIDRGSGPQKFAEWREGDVTGLLPYSRLVAAPGMSIVQETSEILVVPREHMTALARECNGLTSILVHRMIDRAREFTSSELHDEKMISLGRLSAGLAHELNNPASAIERSAALLAGRARGRRAGRAHTRHGGPDGRPVRRHRRCAQRVRGGARAGSSIADRARGTRRGHHRLARGPRPRHGRGRRARRNRRDDRGARSARRRRRWSRAQRRVALGGRRMLGSPPRIGDPGRRDADRRPRAGRQGLHAHGPGDRRRAGGSRPKPRKHGRGSEIEGARASRSPCPSRWSRISRASAGSPAS